MNVAQLKPSTLKLDARLLEPFPRLNERGSIEAFTGGVLAGNN